MSEEYWKTLVKDLNVKINHLEFVSNEKQEKIEQLQQENKQLKEKIKWYEKENKHNQEIIVKDTNILTELEEWLNECLEKGYKHKFIVIRVKDVLDKIQELKEKYK